MDAEFPLDQGQIRALQQADLLRAAGYPLTSETLRSRIGDTPDPERTLAYFGELGLVEWMVYPSSKDHTYEFTARGRAAIAWALSQAHKTD